MKKVSISNGNSKMGAVASVSLPPIVTCPARCKETCAKKCYAARLCKIRKTVREAYARNLEILNLERARYFKEVDEAVKAVRFFRWHVSGDIPDADYFENMCSIAFRNPHTEMLVFTKQYEIVNEWIETSGDLPKNLHVLLSGWSDILEPINPHNLPIAQVILKGTEPKSNWKICGGNCLECGCRGVGCWQAQKGDTIAFKEH